MFYVGGIDKESESLVDHQDVAMLLEADDHGAAAAIVILDLTAAEERAPRAFAGAALAAGRQADGHGDRAASFWAAWHEDRLIRRLFAAATCMLMTVGMLVAILDARVCRAADISSAGRLHAARRLKGRTARLDATRLASAARLDGITVTQAGIGRTTGQKDSG